MGIFFLLIEPVWNRNIILPCLMIARVNLLIEPVWNRNVVYCNFTVLSPCLLIEPVWNRNFQYVCSNPPFLSSF